MSISSMIRTLHLSRRVIGPGKNFMELFFNAKFDFISTRNRDSCYLSPYASGLSVPCRGQGEITMFGQVVLERIGLLTTGTGVLG